MSKAKELLESISRLKLSRDFELDIEELLKDLADDTVDELKHQELLDDNSVDEMDLEKAFEEVIRDNTEKITKTLLKGVIEILSSEYKIKVE